MNILHIVPPYFSISEKKFIPAIPNHTIAIALKQQFLGHDVTIAAAKNSDYQGIRFLETVTYDDGDNIKQKIFDHYNIIQNQLSSLRPDIIYDHISNIRTPLFFSEIKNPLCPVLISIEIAPTLEQVQRLSNSMINAKNKPIYVSGISERQIDLWGRHNFNFMVYHGIDEQKFTLGSGSGNYLLSMARITPNKGVHHSISVARKLEEKLLIAGEVHSNDQDYFDKEIKPNLDDDKVVYLGALSQSRLLGYIQDASIFINPIEVEEAFGLTMIENPMCGTPVVAFNRGATMEVVNDRMGVVVEVGDINGMVDQVLRVKDFDRKLVRQRTIDSGFTLDANVERYIDVYKQILSF